MTDATLETPPIPAGAPEGTEGQDAAPAPTGFARALLERLRAVRPSRLELGQLAFLVTIPVFFWVFYTTSSGMIDIMRRDGDDPIGLVGTFIGASAVLAMLAATSWSLGADLGALIGRRQFIGERIVLKTVITLAVFLFVFSISAFFSFTYYYNNIFRLSSKKIAGELQPMALAAEVLLPAEKAIAQSFDAQTERLFTAPAMRRQLDAIDAIAQAASGDAGPRLRDHLRNAQDEIQRAAAAEARKNAVNLQEAQALARQIEETEQKIAALDRTIANLEPIIKQKQDEAEAALGLERQEEQLALDAAKGLDNLGPACGPNCSAHRAKAATAHKRLEALRETLARPSSERTAAVRQRDGLAADLIMLRQQRESALARSAAAPVMTREAPMDLAETLRALAKARDDIRANPSLATLRAATPSCHLLLVAERQAKAAPPLPADFACDADADDLHALFAERDAVIAGRAAFDKQCTLDGELRDALQTIVLRIRNAPDSDKTAAAAGFGEAKKRVDACVIQGKAAGLSEADVQAALKRSDDFLRKNSLERNRFELAREAFVSLSPDATMAIGVAIAQDAFMFVMKLLSELMKREATVRERRPLPALLDLTDSDGDECDARVIKTLLRGSRPTYGAMSAFDARSSDAAALPEHVQENLIGLLNRLVRHGVAYVDRKGVYVLDDETLLEAETRLEALLKRQRLRATRAGAFHRSEEIALWGGELAAGDARFSGRPRRGFGGLQRYLSPRFLFAGEEPGEGASRGEASHE